MPIQQSIVVFASKRVGLECIRFLIDRQAPVFRLIVGNPQDQEMIDLVRKYGVQVDVFCDAVVEELIACDTPFTWLLNLWSPYILPKALLGKAVYRLNVHPSLVPHCRGNDNAAWTIRQGLPAGVSLIEMTERVDVGGVYVQKAIEYEPLLTKGKDLHRMLEDAAIGLFCSHWENIFSNPITTYQVGSGSKHTRQQTNLDRICSDVGKVETVVDFIKWIQAHDFSPRTTAELNIDGKSYSITLNVTPK